MYLQAIRTFSVLLIAAISCSAGWDEGVAAFKKKDYNAAVGEFQKVIRQEPRRARGHYMLGLSLESLKRKEEALHHLRKAYDLNPNDLSIKVALGQAYADNGQYAKAEQTLQAARKSHTKPNEQKLIWKQLGYTYEKQKKYPESIEAYEKADDDTSVARLKKARVRRAR